MRKVNNICVCKFHITQCAERKEIEGLCRSWSKFLVFLLRQEETHIRPSLQVGPLVERLLHSLALVFVRSMEHVIHQSAIYIRLQVGSNHQSLIPGTMWSC